jgi:hypothetical protein
MYDPYQRHDLHYHGGETISMDAFDLTQVSTAFDDIPSDDGMQVNATLFDDYPEAPATPESFYMDLTRWGNYDYSFEAEEKEEEDVRIPPARTPSPRTPQLYYERTIPTTQSQPRATPQFSYQRVTDHHSSYYPSRETEKVASPTAPSPLPEFRVFDLTHFLEDGTMQWHSPQQHDFTTQQRRLQTEANYPTPTTSRRESAPKHSSSRQIKYTLATNSSHEYQNRYAKEVNVKCNETHQELL